MVLALVALASACAESAEVGPTGVTEERPAVAIQTAELPSGEVGQPYSATLKASGGSGSYSWSLVSGDLPSGLGLSTAGLIAGTPMQADSGTFTVRATDGNGNSKDQKLSLKVKGGPARIETRSLPDGMVGSAYAVTLEADGGTPGYAWDLAAGSLPSGLALSADGILGGTPTQEGSFEFTVRITDQDGATDTQGLTLTVAPGPSGPVIQTSGLPDGTVGTGYEGQLEASGGAQPYAWSRSAGALPAGLTLSSDGAIRGTPSEAGSATFTARVSDNQGMSDSRQFTIDVAAAAEPPSVETTSLPGGQVGSSYSATLAATGGSQPYAWSVASGSLPAGLSLSGTGEITGTPTTVQESNFVVRVTDQKGLSDTRALSIAVAAEPQPPVIQTSSLANGEVGSAYSATLEASGGAPAYSWSLANGQLPNGLSLSSGGVISGTPSAAQSRSFTVQVTDQNGLTDSRSLTLEVTAAPEPPAIQTTSVPDGQVGNAYSTTLNASGGAPAYSWDLASGSLPAGLSLSNGGTISGTPTASGTGTFTVRVTDQNGLTDTQQLSIAVSAAPQPPEIQTTSLPDGEEGTSYSVQLIASGGTPAYSWNVASGSLPPGISLSSGGRLTGAPNAAGTSTFTVRVTDQNDLTDSRQLSIRVAEAPNRAPSASFSVSCTQLACSTSESSSDADGTIVAWSWSFGDGATSSQRQPSHTYTAGGSYTVTLTVTDDEGATGSASRSVTVSESTGEQPGFQIDLYFDADVPARMRDALREAADHWERVIQTDLSSRGPLAERNSGDRCDHEYIEFIDDVAIVVHMVDFSGGLLARAGPCILRSSSSSEANLPVYGSVEVDLGSDGWSYDKAVEIVKHEIGHVLGIGPVWRPLIQDPCGDRPYFAEPNAVREYAASGGEPADRVYVQNGVQSSTSCRPGGHWGYLMENELMSPSTSLSGPIQPLSRVTVGALADLGWSVDYSAADPFSPRSPSTTSAVPAGESYTDIVVGPMLPDPGPSRR